MKYSNKNVESVKNAKIEKFIQTFNEEPSKKNFYKVLNLLYAAGEIDRKFIQPYIEGIDDLNPDKLEISFSGVPYAVSAANPDANETMRFAEIYTSLDKCKNIAIGEFVEYAAVSIRDFFNNVFEDDNLDGIVINMGTDEFTLTKSEMDEVIDMRALKNNGIIEESIINFRKQNTRDNFIQILYNIFLTIRTGGGFLLPVKTHENGSTDWPSSTFLLGEDHKEYDFVNVYTKHDYCFYDSERNPGINVDENISLEYIGILQIIIEVFEDEHLSGIVINYSSRTQFLLHKNELMYILDFLKEDES